MRACFVVWCLECPWVFVTIAGVCMSNCVGVSFELFHVNEIQRLINTVIIMIIC